MQLIAGRYVVLEPLGTGSAAEVYRVLDQETGTERALKILRPPDLGDPGALARALHREFELLTRVRHPHLVQVHDFGSAPAPEGGPERPWFTMDLVPGRSADRALAGPQDPGVLARFADAVLDALAALHDIGLVHRDVTASNILVGPDLTQDPPPVWLMDLGLSDRIRTASAGVVHGTPATLAPETLRGDEVDGRADLYSLGCVLYRLATGQDPFLAPTVWDVLRAHLGTAPTPPRHLAPGLPSSLERFVLRLLAKDPAARPATAQAARRELAPLSGRAPQSVPPLSRALEPSLAGRARELAIFGEALAGLAEGKGAVLLVTGPGGIGRTRLLAEFRLAARLAGLPATFASAAEAPRRPFGFLDLAARRHQPAAPPAAGEGVVGRADEFAALLGTPPSVLLADDVPDGDAASREAFLRLASRIRERTLTAVLAVSVPEGACHDTEFHDRLLEQGSARVVRLRPLDGQATARMAASMLGRSALPEGWEVPLAERTQGVPGAIVELLNGLVVARGVPASGDLPDDPGFAAAADAGAGTTVTRVWPELDESARAALLAVAIADGEPVPLADLEKLDPHAAVGPAAIDPLVAARLLVRTTADGGLAVMLPSRSVAVAALALTDAGRLRLLHRRRAETLTGRPGFEAARARHLLAAGETDAAIALAVQAASGALRDGTPREALRLADEALPVARTRSAALRRLRAEALSSAGRAADAASEFERAVGAARSEGDPLELAACLERSGAFRGNRGDAAGGLVELDEALALLDEAGDTGGGARALLETGRLLRREGRDDDAAARFASALSQARRAGRTDLETNALLALGEEEVRRGRPAAAGELFRNAEALAARTGSAAARSEARRCRIRALESAGQVADALAESEGWIAEAQRAGDLGAQAEAESLAGRMLAAEGRRTAAIRSFESALAARRRMGLDAHAAEILASLARLALERGQPRTARARAQEALDLADRASAVESRRLARRELARVEAALGHPRAVDAQIPPDSPEVSASNFARAERDLLAGAASLAAGDVLSARGALQEACFLARRSNFTELEEFGLLGLAEALAALGELDRARLAVRRARQSAEARGAEEELALARLVEAEVELRAGSGDLQRARDEAEHAARTLDRRERGDVAWRAFAALAAAAERLDDDATAERASDEAFRRLDAWLAALPEADRESWRRKPSVHELLAKPRPGARPAVAVPAGEGALARRVEHLERLLEINRALNSTLDLRGLLQLLLDTAVELTGAERGFVLLEHGEGAAVELARGEGGTELSGADREASRALARDAMREGRPLVASDALADERLSASRSVHALRIRAVLAAPLTVRGAVAGALVLDSRRAAGALGQAELELVGRLAEQAGIALGNARLVDELRRQAEEIRRLNERLAATVEEQRLEIIEKQSNLEVRFRFDCLIGASPAMQKVYRSLDKIVPTEIPVLVTGESGTGKDLVARVLHYNGSRREARFVTVNCAALTETLLESELFGHRKGAFTGADRDRRGLFEQAAGGTLFLDEIAEMPLHLQPKLLRAIQFGEVRRVGEDTPRTVDVRIVAATNRDVSVIVREGRFREDLFYRLDVARVHMAPLRERLEDLELLVDHFLGLAAEKAGGDRKRIEPAGLRLFRRHTWPGNVRELENEVTKIAAFTEGPVITELDVLENGAFLERAAEQTAPAEDDADVTTLEQAEIDQIRSALRAVGGNRTRAAEMLGIDRSTLYRKLKRLGE